MNRHLSPLTALAVGAVALGALAPAPASAKSPARAKSSRSAQGRTGAPATAARKAQPGTFYIQGGGYGHGIGMSQYGAYGYALHGADYRSILEHYYQGTSIGTTSPSQIVKVLLATGQASFSGATEAGGKKLDPSTTYQVKALADGTLRLVPNSGKKLRGTFTAPLTVTGPTPLQLAGHGTYQGALVFTPATRGVQSVNAVSLDDYVEGVVPAEMPSTWAPQALEAQAIAARTYAITTAVGGNGYDLYADTRSQMYGGVGVETAATDAAVQATSGQVVTYNGQPVVTYFFSSSGGYTESIQNVWAGSTPEPWLQGVPDPFDGVAGNPYHRWSYRMSVAAATRKLGSLVKGQLLGIRVIHHGVSPRIVEAQVVGTKGSSTVSGGRLQQIFGLPTTFASFTVISSTASGGALTGTVSASSPAPNGAVALQAWSKASWHTVARAPMRAGLEDFSVNIPRSARYRVTYAQFRGPAMFAIKPKLRPRPQLLVAAMGGVVPAWASVYAGASVWPAARHRRTIRPLSLVLRAP